MQINPNVNRSAALEYMPQMGKAAGAKAKTQSAGQEAQRDRAEISRESREAGGMASQMQKLRGGSITLSDPFVLRMACGMRRKWTVSPGKLLRRRSTGASRREKLGAQGDSPMGDMAAYVLLYCKRQKLCNCQSRIFLRPRRDLKRF